MRSPWIIQGGTESNDKYLYKRRDDTDTQRQRAEAHVKTEAETVVMRPQAKEYLQPSEAGIGKEGF